ncbi:MAG: hypothetical protein ACFFBP_00055 [Promethearchaeota archaeon]
MAESEQLNVKDWITLSTVMIGAVLTILALIWQRPPNYSMGGYRGIGTATFFLMISFIFFVNSVSTNSRANFEARSGKTPEIKINKFITLAEYSFGFGFTLVVCGFSLLGYSYLMEYLNGTLIALLLPIVFIAITLIVMLTYNIISSGSPLGNLKRTIWAIIEIIFVVLICFDFFGLYIIP